MSFLRWCLSALCGGVIGGLIVGIAIGDQDPTAADTAARVEGIDW